MTAPSRRDRLGDLLAIVLIVVGVALWMTADTRLRDIAQLSYRHPGPPSVSQLAAADRARYIAYGGVGLILCGCVVAVAGAVRISRRTRLVTS